MRYIITGGAGFIGTNLVEHLLSLNHEVIVIDNFSTGKNIVQNVQYIKADIRQDLTKYIQNKDILVHLAALPSVQRSIENPVEVNDVNITGTLNVLQACVKANTSKVVFISSSSVYGRTEGLQSEVLQPDPLSPYALTKLTGEYYTNLYNKLYGLDTIILRFFNVFGKYQKADSEYSAVIPLFKSGQPVIYGDGKQSRDFTHVSNNVSAIYKASLSNSNDTFNIACGTSYNLLEICKMLGKKPKFAPARQGEIKHSKASIVKAQRVLSYEVITEFEKGLWM